MANVGVFRPLRGRNNWLLPFSLGLTLLSCSKDSAIGTAPLGPPAQLTIVAGEGQSGIVGQELSNPLVVKVMDSQGRAISGQAVNFRVTAGGGSVFAGASVTNADGLAQERWSLGTKAGEDQTVEARAVDNATGKALVFATFHATAIAGDPSALNVVRQPASSAKSAQPLAVQPIVRLVDRYGNAVQQSGVKVTAALLAPATSVTLSGTTTVATGNDGVGTFSNLAISGPTGSVTFAFSAQGLTAVNSEPVVISAGVPTQLAGVGASSFVGTVGQPLTALPRVIIRDAAGNPVPGVTINFALSSDGGAISPSSVQTDSSGEAGLTSWMLSNHAGTALVTASASAVEGAVVTFSATAQPAAAATLTRVDQGDLAGEVGTTLPAIHVRISDSFGNAIPGVAVTFTVVAPGASVSTGGASGNTANATSDTSGVASVRWSLGTTAGTQTLTISAQGIPSLGVSAAAQAGPAAQVSLMRAPSSSSASGMPFVTQPVVSLSDRYGNTVGQSGVVVSVSAPTGYTIVGSGTASTDAAGTASFSGLGLTGPAGSALLTFSASGLTPATATLVVTVGEAATMIATSPTTITDTAAARVSSGNLPAVLVKDAGGNPVAGLGIAFRVGSEGGTVSSGSTSGSIVTVTTDANGVAKVSGWQLPSRTGTASVTAAALSLQVAFTATVTAGNPSALAVIAQPSTGVQSGVAFPVTVQLRDHSGNVSKQAGIVVTGAVTAPYSVTGGATATTDANGSASFNGLVITGPTGAFLLTFTSPGLTYTATQLQMQGASGTPGQLATISPVGSTQLAGAVATTLKLTVQAVDADSRGIPGITINWSTTSGAATVLTSSSTTDSLGNASTTIKLPNTVQSNTIQAAAASYPNVAPTMFTIAAKAGRPCTYRWSNNDQTGERGEPLPLQLKLVALDSLGNPVPNVTIAPNFYMYNWAPWDVTGTIEPVTTDSTGLSSTGGHVTLGSYIGAQELTYLYEECYNSGPNRFQTGTAASFTATTSALTQILNKVGSPSGATGSTVQLSVEAIDKHGWYLPDVALTFAVTGSDGAFSNGSTSLKATTSNNGYAIVSYVVGASPTETVTVSAPNIPSVVITIQRSP